MPRATLPLPATRRRRLLLLNRRQLEALAHPVLERLPVPVVDVLVPRKQAHPRLDVVVQAQGDVVGRGELAGGVGDFVLVTLVFEDEFTAIIPTP